MAISASHRCVLVIRTILYGITVLSSFFVFGALAVSMSRHDENCLLYVKDAGRYKYTYSSRSPCQYSIAVAVVFCLVCPVLIIIVTILAFLGIIREKLVSFTNQAFLFLTFLDILSFVFVLVSASIISAGFKQTCDVMIDGRDAPCSLIHASKRKDFFYVCLAVAEGGAWTAFMSYLLQVMIDVGVLYTTNRLKHKPRRDSTSAETQAL